MEQAAGLPSRRIGLRTGPDKVLYYEIDAGGSVYWLLPRKSNRMERRLVQDVKFAEFIRQQAVAQAKGVAS